MTFLAPLAEGLIGGEATLGEGVASKAINGLGDGKAAFGSTHSATSNQQQNGGSLLDGKGYDLQETANEVHG